MKKKIELYLDGATIKEIKEFKNIDGYTFNPTLFNDAKKSGFKI